MKIRIAEPADLQGLIHLEEECFGAEKFSENTLMAVLAREDAIAIVAELDGRIVGATLCLFSRIRAEGRVVSMAVLEEWRRKGIATSLLSESEDALERMGAKTFVLEVGVENAPAITLYQKHGYSLRAIIRDYYGVGRHAFAMEKVLQSTKKKFTVRLS